MQPGFALSLRLIGPLIEAGCIAALFAVRGRNLSLLGLPVEFFLYAGIGFGLVLVVAGLFLGRASARPVDEWDHRKGPRSPQSSPPTEAR